MKLATFTVHIDDFRNVASTDDNIDALREAVRDLINHVVKAASDKANIAMSVDES